MFIDVMPIDTMLVNDMLTLGVLTSSRPQNKLVIAKIMSGVPTLRVSRLRLSMGILPIAPPCFVLDLKTNKQKVSVPCTQLSSQALNKPNSRIEALVSEHWLVCQVLRLIAMSEY